MRRLTPRQAQELDGLKNWRYAWLKVSVAGRYARFRKGTKVRAKHDVAAHYTIERDKWRGSLVPLTNRMAGVPRACLIFATPAREGRS